MVVVVPALKRLAKKLVAVALVKTELVPVALSQTKLVVEALVAKKLVAVALVKKALVKVALVLLTLVGAKLVAKRLVKVALVPRTLVEETVPVRVMLVPVALVKVKSAKVEVPVIVRWSAKRVFQRKAEVPKLKERSELGVRLEATLPVTVKVEVTVKRPMVELGKVAKPAEVILVMPPVWKSPVKLRMPVLPMTMDGEVELKVTESEPIVTVEPMTTLVEA
ncbi:MAG: hypothetical protein FD130_2639 [Halothiobacillaceae bacterium]|nr:MAG: hypothetical protein FD130_2639 [Halothiobacillaceae bacterium]